MGSQKRETEEVYVVLSREERAVVKAIEYNREGLVDRRLHGRPLLIT